MKKLVILAILLRVLVSAFFFHPDIKTFNYQASFLKAGVTNIYTYLADHKKELPLKEEFVYFPLTYFTLGAYQVVASPALGAGFEAWLADANVSSFVENPYIFKYLLVLKLPYLTLDLAIGFMLYRYFDNKKKGEKALIIWLFNPFTIVLFYIFGNVDIFPVALTVFSLWSLRRKRMLSASVALGLAAGFKLYPILLVPYVVMTAGSRSEKVKALVVPLAVFAAVTLPFLSGAFVNSALVSGLSTRIFNPGVTIGFNETIITGLFAYIAVLTSAYFAKKKASLVSYFVVSLLLIFSFAHFHIQWLSWVTPFIVIIAVKKPKLGWIFLLTGVLAFLIPPLYEDRSMTISLFRAYSTLYDILPTPFTLLRNFYDPFNLQSILHTAFAGVNIVLAYKLLSRKGEV